jgi:hypothetical protein
LVSWLSLCRRAAPTECVGGLRTRTVCSTSYPIRVTSAPVSLGPQLRHLFCVVNIVCPICCGFRQNDAPRHHPLDRCQMIQRAVDTDSPDQHEIHGRTYSIRVSSEDFSLPRIGNSRKSEWVEPLSSNCYWDSRPRGRLARRHGPIRAR